jgi:phage gp36-like protein
LFILTRYHAYGTNYAVQLIAFGKTNSAEDARIAQALASVTAYINAYINRTTDITTPSNQITQATNYMAAAMMTTPANTMTENAWWKMGLKLLKLAKGELTTDGDYGYTFYVGRE